MPQMKGKKQQEKAGSKKATRFSWQFRNKTTQSQVVLEWETRKLIVTSDAWTTYSSDVSEVEAMTEAVEDMRDYLSCVSDS
jgi:hypothetical protein